MDKQAVLYNGEVHVEFQDRNHTYYVSDSQVDDGRIFKPASVTQILKHSDKPALPQWAANQVVEFVRDYWKPGRTYSQREIDALLQRARFSHKDKARSGADFGTMGHQYLEKYIRSKLEFGAAPDLPEHPESREACQQMTEWMKENVDEFVGCEILIYSRKLRIASTLDVMTYFKEPNLLTLFDWKFASGIWNEYRWQTAAYCKIYEECFDEMPKQRYIPWWDKKEKKFKPTLLPMADIENDFKAFCGFIPVHERVKELQEQNDGRRHRGVRSGEVQRVDGSSGKAPNKRNSKRA